jgi:hypothetical protein
MDLENPITIRRLPLLRNFEDAEALYKKENEPFYLAAFLIQCWLGGLVVRAAAQYAEHKNPKDRSLQSGEAWRSLGEFFNLKPESKSLYLFSCLFRLSLSDDSPTNSLRHALTPLLIEHRLTSEYLVPNTELKTQNSKLRPPLRIPHSPLRTPSPAGATGSTPKSISAPTAVGTMLPPVSIPTPKPATSPPSAMPSATSPVSMTAPKPVGSSISPTPPVA